MEHNYFLTNTHLIEPITYYLSSVQIFSSFKKKLNAYKIETKLALLCIFYLTNHEYVKYMQICKP